MNGHLWRWCEESRHPGRICSSPLAAPEVVRSQREPEPSRLPACFKLPVVLTSLVLAASLLPDFKPSMLQAGFSLGSKCATSLRVARERDFPACASGLKSAIVC